VTSQTIFLTKKPLEKPRPKYYIYYDEWTGDITNIGNRLHQGTENRITDPYVITDSSVAVDLMKGKISPKKYMVADLADGMTLIERNNALHIKKTENQLSLIPLAKATISSDVNLIFYKSNWLLEVNLNQDTIFKLTGRRFHKKFTESDNVNESKIVLYITEKNNPLILYETIEIDPIDLLNNGYVLVELDHLKTKTTQEDISFITRRIFKDYGLKYKESYDTIDYHSRKSHRRRYTKIHNKSEDWTTFSVSQSAEGWVLKSNFDDPHSEKLFRDIKIFLFDDTPFGLLDKITVPYDMIGRYQEYLIKTSVDPTKRYMMLGEENKRLSFKIENLRK